MRVDVARRRRRTVSLTPLIDVVFNLLLFFMLASTLTQWRSLAVATGSEAATVDTPPAAEVEQQRDGQYRYDGNTLSLDTLAQQLAAALESKQIASVIVRPGEGVRLGAVITTFDQLNHLGIEALALGAATSGAE